MKLAVLYHSETGNTEKAAAYVAAGMEKVEGVTAVTYNIKNVTDEDLADVVGVAIGAPTYYADMSWQMLQFLESRINLSDKLGGSFSTANFSQGGSELVLQNINNVMLAKGMTVYSGGTSHGQPFTHVGINAFVKESTVDARQELLEIFGERFAKKAAEYFG